MNPKQPAANAWKVPRGATGFRDSVENSPHLARFAAHHRPFYERLYAQRLDVTPWEHADHDSAQ
jgi:hypothetical protein